MHTFNCNHIDARSIESPSVNPPGNCAANHRRGTSAAGFTLVEILTVIAIIVILMGMLFVALKYVRAGAATSSTKVAMDNLRGMLGDLDAANRLARPPTAWLWWHATTTSPPYVVTSGSSADFWRYPFSASTTPPLVWDPLDAPGDVRTDTGPPQDISRNASFAVLNTQLAMQLIATVSANHAALDKIPEDGRFIPLFQPGSVPVPVTGLLAEDGSDATQGIQYLSGMHVTYQGKFYICSGAPTSAPPTPGSTVAPWIDETASPRGAPVLKDGWGNPIIFVPASGLHVKRLNGQSTYAPADPNQNFIIVSPEGSVSGNGTATPVVTKVGRPFFASAGADGDFTKGDDNVYSFEN